MGWIIIALDRIRLECAPTIRLKGVNMLRFIYQCAATQPIPPSKHF
ncbi:MAG TPA: hypothetical protein P5228_05140 [Bacteroidales bacterium]|nr:hypothetical protein [Bacteroidales bacterium]